MPRTIQADGRTITVPDDATPDEINQIVGPAPTQSKSAPPPTEPPQQSWWDRVTAPYTEIQKPDPNHPWAPSEAAKAVGNIGAGALSVVLHPINTVTGALEGLGGLFTAPFEKMAGSTDPTVYESLYHNLKENPYGTLEAMGGQAAATPILAEEVKAPIRAAKIIPRAARAGADILAGTTPKVAQELGESTQAANVEAATKAAEANAKAQTQRGVDLQKHFEKTQQIRAQNEAAQAAQSRKVALERGVEQLDPKFQEDLKATEKNVRAQANDKYNAVRAATEGETVPSASLAEAVKTAEAKIQGSSENLKIFRDILSKHPEGEPESIAYQGTQIPKGHPLYDVLKEGEQASTSPATFSDLQGYYTELGNQLSKGNLPGDVYLAMKSLQESVGDLMQKMAESKGVGSQLTDARAFYRDYMDAFRDSKSPLNRAMNATERGKSIQALRSADQSGIETLARYNPELARRANTIRGYQAEAKSIPARTTTPKPEPTLPPKPAPVQPETKTVNREDIRNAKTAAMQKQADYIRKRGAAVASGIGAWRLMSHMMSGDIGGMLGSAGNTAIGIGATQGLAMLLENPKIVRYLTNPTPSDIAAIPADVRPQLPQIVKAAQAQGIKVHPALIALGGSAAQQTQPAAQPAQ